MLIDHCTFQLICLWDTLSKFQSVQMICSSEARLIVYAYRSKHGKVSEEMQTVVLMLLSEERERNTSFL